MYCVMTPIFKGAPREIADYTAKFGAYQIWRNFRLRGATAGRAYYIVPSSTIGEFQGSGIASEVVEPHL